MKEIELVLERDSMGFPWVWVSAIDAWLQWFPLTKIQFEIFLSESTSARFSAKTYGEMLACNPRLDLQALDTTNYWRVFLTGLLPAEAEELVAWYGPSYRLPTIDEWSRAYRFLDASSAPTVDWSSRLAEVPARRLALVQRLDAVANALPPTVRPGSPAQHSLADRMLLKNGVVEWVRDEMEPPNFGGLGEPHSSFTGQLTSLEILDPIEPRDPHGERVRYFGTRLLCSDFGGQSRP